MRKLRFSLLIVVVLLVGLQVAAAQTSTPFPPPDPLDVTEILDGALQMISSLGLFALVSIAAFVGVAFMLVRRFRRAAM